jgi:hypothetical protein
MPCQQRNLSGAIPNYMKPLCNFAVTDAVLRASAAPAGIALPNQKAATVDPMASILLGSADS